MQAYTDREMRDLEDRTGRRIAGTEDGTDEGEGEIGN